MKLKEHLERIENQVAEYIVNYANNLETWSRKLSVWDTRKKLSTQFGILDHPYGFDVTANSDSRVVYATVTDEGVYHLRAETILNLPGWHQVFLHNTLNGKEVVVR